MWLAKWESWHIYLFAGIWCLFALGLIIATPQGFTELGRLTYSPTANSFYSIAHITKDPVKFVEHFPKLEKMPIHVRTHPPGSVLFYYGINKAAEYLPGNLESYKHEEFKHLTESQLRGLYLSSLLVIIIASLSIVFSYKIAKLIYDDKTAKNAALISSSVPAIALFSPGLDIMYPTFLLASLYLFIKYKSKLSDIANGFLIGIYTFFSFPLGLVAIVLGSWKTKYRIKRCAFVIVGILICILCLTIVLKYNIIDATSSVLAKSQAHYTARDSRSYLTWLFMNPIDFLVFSILPFIAYAWKSKNQKLTKIWFTIFILILITGIFRGEVQRTLMFLMPLLVIPIAHTTKHLSKKQVLVLAGLNFLLAITLAYKLDLLDPTFILNQKGGVGGI